MINLFENFKFKELNTKNLKLMVKRAYEKYKGANSSFWVTSLSFYTILAIVPILAILVSLGSWFGAKDYIINQIKDIAPLKGETLELLTDFSNKFFIYIHQNYFFIKSLLNSFELAESIEEKVIGVTI